MATTIINPAPSSNTSDSNSMGFLLGIIVLAVFAVLFFVYALPLIREFNGFGGAQVNVPKTIDVNVKQSK